MYKAYRLFVLFLFFGGVIFAQNFDGRSSDELHQRLEKNEDTSHISINAEVARRLQEVYDDDASRIYIDRAIQLSNQLQYFKHLPYLFRLKSIYYDYAKNDDDSVIIYLSLMLDAARKHGSDKQVTDAMQILATRLFITGNTNDAMHYADELISRGNMARDTLECVNAITLKSEFMHGIGDFEGASELANEAGVLAELITNEDDRARAFLHIGSMFWGAENYIGALRYHLKAAECYQHLEDTFKLYEVYFNINSLYDELGNFPKALNYGRKMVALAKLLDDKAEIATSYNSLGWTFKNLQINDSALLYFHKALDMYRENIPDDISVAYPLGNIGLILTLQHQFDSAVHYSKKARELFEKMKFQSGVAESNNNIGMALLGMGDLDAALEMLELGLHQAELEGDIFEMRNSHKGLYRAYAMKGDFQSALRALETVVSLNDSLYNIERISATQEMEAQLAKKRDEAMIDALRTKADLDKKLIEKQQIINYSIGGLALVILASLGFIFRSWREKKKAYTALEKQHEELRESKHQIELQNEKINFQKMQIEGQHKDIIDSINFASRIQQALLKPEDHVNKKIPKHFIYYMPRDIVSGDFYWAVLRDDLLYVAAADCTGHGVPGAMMSMLGIAFLNEIAADRPNITPAEILEELRLKIIKELRQEENKGSNYHEGMEMSLVRINLKSNEMLFAGANNPLWLLRNNEVITYKGSKQGICYAQSMTPFENQTIQLLPNDSFYIFSDGYADQFGGERGKKFKYATLKNLLLNIHHRPMSEQREILHYELETWKGDMDQVDDVCVIGMNIS